MIAIDTTFFAHSEIKNGRLSFSTSIFTADLLDAFTEAGESKNFCLIVNYNHEAFFRKRFPAYELVVLKFFPLSILNKITKGKTPATKLLKKFGIFRGKIKRDDRITAVWFPYTVSTTFVETGKPALLTIHDLYQFHSGIDNDLFKKIIADEKNKIAAISSYTKGDIEKTFSYKREISVIPNSVNFDVSNTQKVEGVSQPFILDINAYDKKKNALTLLRAFDLIKDKTSCQLVFCGGYKNEQYFAQMKTFAQENGLESRVLFLFQIPESQRNWLLKNARLFVTPSLFEGFGRTPVEAAICKVPVISTKATSLYEATLGLLNYYENPTDEKELSDLMLKKVCEGESEEKLSAIAEKLKSQYLPQNCSKKYLEILKGL